MNDSAHNESDRPRSISLIFPSAISRSSALAGDLGVICFLTSREGMSTAGAIERDAAAPKVTVLPYDEALVQPALPKATYVFTDFDRLNTNDLVEAARLFRRLEENGCRVLNDPARVRTRFALLRGLYRSGLNPINAYSAEEDNRPTRYPVFIRIGDGHDGTLTGLLWDQSELDLAIEAAIVAGFPQSRILIIEYAAQPIRPGVFRKSSVYRVGDYFITDICWHDTFWEVKSDR